MPYYGLVYFMRQRTGREIIGSPDPFRSRKAALQVAKARSAELRREGYRLARASAFKVRSGIRVR